MNYLGKIEWDVPPSEFPKGPKGNRRLYWELGLLRHYYNLKVKDPKYLPGRSLEDIINYYKLIMEEMRRRGLKPPAKPHPLDRLIKEWRANAMYLVEPHARWIYEGKKKLIIKVEEFPGSVCKSLILAGDQLYGKIHIKEIRPMTPRQVTATRFAHLVSPQEIREWWGEPKQFYGYIFDFRKFREPIDYPKPPGVQTFFILPQHILDNILSKKYDQHYFWDLDLPRTIDWVLDFAEALKHFKGLTILDIGCGEGSTLQILERTGYKCEGVEKYQIPYTKAKSKNLKVTLGSAESLPYKDGSFDTTFSLHLLEHIIDDEHALKEAIRVAKYVSVHVVPLGARKDQTHIWSYCEDDIKQLCDATNSFYYLYPSGTILEGKPSERVNAIIVHQKASTIRKRFVKLPKPGYRVFEPKEILDIKNLEFPMLIAKKYDGAHTELVTTPPTIYSEAAKIKNPQFKEILKQLAKLPPQTVLACELVMYQDGKPLHRTAATGYMNSKEYDPQLEKACIFHAYDILRIRGQDLRKRPYGERLKILKTIKDQPNIKKMKIPGEAYIVQNEKQLMTALTKVRKLPGSEGAIITALSSKYQVPNMRMAKLKNLYEVDVMVVESVETKVRGVYNHYVAAGPLSPECVKAYKKHYPKKLYMKEGKGYVILGKTFSTKLKPPKHNIIRVKVLEIRKDPIADTGCYLYGFMTPHVMFDVTEAHPVPDTIGVLDRLAKLTRPVRKQKKPEPLPEPLPPKSYKWRPPCDPKCRFVLQEHKPEPKKGKLLKATEIVVNDLIVETLVSKEFGCKLACSLLENQIIKSLMNQLITVPIVGDIILKFRWHLDLRLQIGKFLIGIGLHPPQKVPGGPLGEFIRRMKRNAQTQGAAKLPQPLDWLEVGKAGKWQRLPPGTAGATRLRAGLMRIVDEGTYRPGVQRKGLHEYFFYGKILKGRWVLRALRVAGKINWFFWKPKDQTPMDPVEHEDEGYYKIDPNEKLTAEHLKR